MNEITREEIELAIEYYKENEFYMQKYNADVVTARMNEIALYALRAELSRKENAPLTCDGCEYNVRDEGSMRYTRCGNCIRRERPWASDRYEPKGDHHE